MQFGWCFMILFSISITILTAQNSSESTQSPLKCTRDYHCPSTCDVCRGGICTHPINLSCSRDYHCPKCEVCLNGICKNGDRKEQTCTQEDAWKTCLDVEKCDENGKCVRNLCDEDEECGGRGECKAGNCVYF